jgi:hypothetical protein
VSVSVSAERNPPSLSSAQMRKEPGAFASGTTREAPTRLLSRRGGFSCRPGLTSKTGRWLRDDRRETGGRAALSTQNRPIRGHQG